MTSVVQAARLAPAGVRVLSPAACGRGEANSGSSGAGDCTVAYSPGSSPASFSSGFVDGINVDEFGNVYVTGPGGIWVYASDGTRLGTIQIPEQVANRNWGDDDWKSLYVTATTSVDQLRMEVAGNRLGYMS